MTAAPHTRTSVVATIRGVGIIPVIRAESADVAQEVVEALVSAGLAIAEITMTVPGAIEAIASLSKRFGSRVLIGAGTVTDSDTVRRAVDAGAEFIVSPCVVREVIEASRRAEVVVMPGALSPTEVFDAFRLGGDLVKVFPVANVGGASYLRALRGPFPDVPLVPTGGVTLENLTEMFSAGAAAVGVGSELVSKSALQRGDYNTIESLARQFLTAARKARA